VIDLHCHLLPGVDDGSQSVDRSVTVLREQAARGVADMVLTPHLAASDLEKGVPPAHDRAFAELVARAPATPRLHRGAEVMLDRPVSAIVAGRAEFRLGGGAVMLVEFPRMVAFEAAWHALRHLAELGVVPLLAHPERYASCTPSAVARWREVGSLMQVDATTVLQPNRRGDRARQLLAHGLADVVAADNHGDDRSLGALRDALVNAGAVEVSDLLTRVNPTAVLTGLPLVPVPPITVKLSLADRLRRLLVSEP
jgi:protein-tyrosine phosphatase